MAALRAKSGRAFAAASARPASTIHRDLEHVLAHKEYDRGTWKHD
jgi:hypothetical protein